jgi:hypothetical protein
MINQTHASQVHARTRISTYQPQRAIVAVKIVSFVQPPVIKTIVWNRQPRPVINTVVINGTKWHEISIGAGMTHKFKQTA